ncbi:MAG TPA: hypothetical protein VKA74_12465 [Myxococcota bacterium]|nr:hypothetical protein [Myxococcota bacterium]
MSITITPTFTVEEQTLADLLITAFEGGSNYWVSGATPLGAQTVVRPWYSDPEIWKAPALSIYLTDAETGERYELTPEGARKGLELLATKHPQHWADLVDENMDAVTADVWLQLSVFGEIVFG